MAKPTPKYNKGDRVRYRGGSPFIVEKVYTEKGLVFYDLREELSELLLKMTTRQLERGVEEKFVSAY